MSVFLLVGLVFGVCYLLARPVFSTRWPLFGFRALFLSGTELLLVGFALGPSGLAILSPELTEALDPLLHLGVGWAGLVFGLQFDRRMLRHYPAPRYLVSFAQAILTGLLCGAGVAILASRLFPEADRDSLLRLGVLAGVCAAPTSPASIHYFTRLFRIRGRVNRLLKFIVGVDGIPSVLALGVFAGFYHVSAADSGSQSLGAHWLLIEIGLGILLGLLLTTLVELELSRDELLLFVLGMAVLAGGLAHYLHLSALFTNFVIGVTVANRAWHREEVHKVLAHAEKPIYLTLMVLAGSNLVLEDVRVFVVAGGLVLLRILGKVISNVPWRWLGFEPRARSPWLGLSLLSQGALVVMLAVDFEYLFRLDAGRGAALEVVVSAVLVAVLVNEVLSPLFLRLLFSTAASTSRSALPSAESP